MAWIYSIQYSRYYKGTIGVSAVGIAVAALSGSKDTVLQYDDFSSCSYISHNKGELDVHCDYGSSYLDFHLTDMQ